MAGKARSVLSAILWIGCLFVFTEQVAGVVHKTGVPISGNDFPAFYCAGTALNAHADPYALEPLRSCEHALPHGSDLPVQYVTPAPLPPYALDVFALLAQLPYHFAARLWFAILAAACVWLALTLARVTGVPSGAVAAALLLSTALGSATVGQIPPLAALFIALCGAALLRGDDALAALFAAASTIEPHVGLPLALSIFFFRPGARGWLLGFGCAALGLSVLAVTPHIALSYLTSVLPEHARAELVAGDQFSLSHLLARLGVPERTALLGGTLSYIVFVGLGLLTASAAARRLDVAALAYLPPAIALFAGTFVHEIQLVAALPAAFLSIARGTPPIAWCGRLLVAAIATVPFTLAMEHRPILDALALLCGTGALVAAVPIGEAADFATALGSFVLAACCVALPLAAQHVVPSVTPTRIAAGTTVARGEDASENWGEYLRSDPRYAATRFDEEASKLPAWLGLAALIAAALGMGMARLGPRTQGVWDPRPRIHLTS